MNWIYVQIKPEFVLVTVCLLFTGSVTICHRFPSLQNLVKEIFVLHFDEGGAEVMNMNFM